MKNITPEEFVKIWQSSSTYQEVQERTGLSKACISSRAGYYRKKGIKLKLMGVPRKPIDVKALNALIKGIKP